MSTQYEEKTKRSPMILQNAVRVKSTNSIYVSTHVHHFVQFEAKGGSGFIDGGTEYLRRGGAAIEGEPGSSDVEDLSFSDEDPIEVRASKMVWGTCGKTGKEKFKWVMLKDCSVEHLKAILVYQFPQGKKLQQWQRDVIEYIIEAKEVIPM